MKLAVLVCVAIAAWSSCGGGGVDALMRSMKENDLCGPHPLKRLMEKMSQKSGWSVRLSPPDIDLDDAFVAKTLVHIRENMPKLWTSYQARLNTYRDCMLMTEAGHFGRR